MKHTWTPGCSSPCRLTSSGSTETRSPSSGLSVCSPNWRWTRPTRSRKVREMLQIREGKRTDGKEVMQRENRGSEQSKGETLRMSAGLSQTAAFSAAQLEYRKLGWFPSGGGLCLGWLRFRTSMDGIFKWNTMYRPFFNPGSVSVSTLFPCVDEEELFFLEHMKSE